MSINDTILEKITPHLPGLDYDTEKLKDHLRKFFSLPIKEYRQRQELAILIASQILEKHSKQDLPLLAEKLANLERNLKELDPYQRDHVCHSLITFLLGYIFIIELNLEEKHQDFLFEWKLAALLHDVGYPLELTDRINSKFFSSFDSQLLDKKTEFEPKGGNSLIKYLELYGVEEKRNALEEINNRLNSWDIKINCKSIFDRMINGKKFDAKPQRTDHGITSAILVMKAIDHKYEKNNPSQKVDAENSWNFDNMNNQITNVCSSIFIHNMFMPEINWDFNVCPIATLLKLCDELQGWDRPSFKNNEGESADNYDFKIIDGRIQFFVKERKLKELKNNLKNVENFPIKLVVLN